MQINIAKTSGFCFGVKRAINTSLSLAKGKKPVYILGDIVHNNFVVKELAKKGIKKISRIKPVKNSILMIRAHGASKKVFKKAKTCGYKIVDTTCPKVKEIYKIAKRLEKNNKIIIIGDHNHDEVKGIAGQLNKKSITIESPNRITSEKLKHIKKAAVVTQSTQTIENINAIMKRLKKIIPQVKLYNTVCRTTILKQQEIKTLPKKNNLILIVGSSTSANTKRLYELSRKINKKTYWIESKKNLKCGWLKDVERIGIMAGASTPEPIVQEIVERIKQISRYY